MPFAGKTALITGAGSGIGRALAIEASRRGMLVALTGRRVENLKLTRSLLAAPANGLVVPGDVTRADARQAIRRRLTDEWGRVDLLINNAGLVPAGPLGTTEDTALERLFAVNLVAPIAMAREFLPLMRAAAPARIVNIGSMLGEIAIPGFAAYSASKSGLRGLSVALRRELKGLGIGVTYAAPRGVRTDATSAIADIVESLEMPLDTTEHVARRIFDGVAKAKDGIYPRGKERLFILAEKLLPSIVDRALNAQLKSRGLWRAIHNANAPTESSGLSQPARELVRTAPSGTRPKLGGI
jgi:short-subunit dehydrogenase